MSGLQNAWAVSRAVNGHCIRLTALNWDEVQLLPWPFWHVGREEDKKRTWIILMVVQRETDQETFLHL